MVEKRKLPGQVSYSRQGGFTLIEVMIVVVIIGILSAIAYPSYTEYVRRARRADGQAALMAVEAAQARWRVTNSSYTNLFSDLKLSAISTDGYYDLIISTVDSTKAIGYKATAKARPGGSQVNDTGCTELVIEVNMNSITRGPAGCWKK